MNASVATAMSILGYNTWLFANAVADVGAERAGFRVNEQTNTFDRLAGHVTVGRHGLAGLLQLSVPELHWGTFGEFGIGLQFELDRDCPSLGQIAEEFGSVTEVLMAGLPGVSEEVLSSPSPLPIPGESPTMLDLLAFMTMHETYHIGQMGLLKKSMGGSGIMEA